MQYDKATPITSVDMFEAIRAKDHPYIFYISTDDCSVCKAIYPKMEDIASQYGMDIYTIDASKHQDISGQLLVFSVPTIIVMFDRKEVYRESRFIQFDQLQRVCELAHQETE